MVSYHNGVEPCVKLALRNATEVTAARESRKRLEICVVRLVELIGIVENVVTYGTLDAVDVNAVTADGAAEYFTNIDESEMPITPITIIIIGCFSRYSIQ